jgi:electron transport complex protein RnfG
MIQLLGAVSLICGVAIVATERSTVHRIRHNQETIMKDSVARLLPGIQKQVVYGIQPSGEVAILPGTESGGPRFFAGYDANGKFLGVVIEASERGYADVISAMYAYSPDTQSITGFQVIDMKETPGLGNKISSDVPFLENFKHLDATHPITTVKHGAKKNAWEIDAISGATISSRAVGRMLQKSVADVAPVIARNLDRIKRGQ